MMKTANSSSLIRRLVITSVIALVALALVISYFTVFRNMTTMEEAKSDEIVLLPGEARSISGSIYLYEQMPSSNISKITVENEHGTYSLTQADDGSSFYIDEDKNAAYDSYMFASLVVATGTTVTSTRVVPAHDVGVAPDSVDFANYGLDEENMSARYTVTSKSGASYSVRIGYEVSSGEGYYACVEGRNAVYIMANDLKKTVLGTVESIITPNIAYPMSASDYHTTDYFTIWHGGEHFLSIHYIATKDEAEKYAAISNYLMTHDQDISAYDVANSLTEKKLDALMGIDLLPYEYTPAIDEFAAVLETLTVVQGDETVAIKQSGEENVTLEQLVSYGINPEKPAHELFYSYQGISNYILFSELQEEGFYYAYSPMYDLIVKINSDTMRFLEWDFPRWVEPAFFQKNINNISDIKLKTSDIDYVFTIDNTTADDGSTSLTVRGNGNILDTNNFRQFYKVALTRKSRGGFTGEVPAEDTLYMTLSITTDAGVTTEYKFYRISTQNLYMTINGEGEFYVLNSTMRKLESDAKKVMAGETVVAYDRK